jgi:hypothetical protein
MLFPVTAPEVYDDNQLAEDMIYYRHWGSISEAFAGADNLLTALERGWKVESVEESEFRFRSRACTTIYDFRLASAQARMLMRVISNPVAARLASEYSQG